MFPLFKAKQSSRKEKEEKAEKKKVIAQFNKDIKGIIDTYVSEHYDEIKKELLDNNVPENEIEQAIQRIRLRMQVNAFNLFKEELKETVLARVEHEKKAKLGPEIGRKQQSTEEEEKQVHPETAMKRFKPE